MNGLSLGRRAELVIGGAEMAAMRRLLVTVTGCRRRVVDVAGLRIPLLERGSGPPLLLLHGFGADKETWLLMVRHLGRRRRLIIPDLPGFGEAPAVPAARASAAAQAAVIAELAAALGIDRCDLAGNSMGGGISQRLAADHPALVRSMVLICSTGPERRKSPVRLAIERGENPLLPRTVDEAERFTKLIFERSPPLPRALQRYYAHDRVTRSPQLAVMWEGWDTPAAGTGIPDEDQLSRLAVPALIIHGDHDQLIHPDTAEALAASLPHAELVMLHGIGHVPQIEAPRRTARLIEEFLGSVGGRDAAAHR